MSRWFRHYAGMCRDDKLVSAALRSKQTVERVVWVWSAILESASEINDDGRYAVDADELAWFLRCKVPPIAAVFDALEAMGRISGGRVCSWSKRQYKVDSSADRVKRYRDARKEAGLVAQWQPSSSLRQEVYAADGHQCVYCGSPDDLTIDHKVPEMHGGTNDRENLHTACRKCNAKKRDLTHDEFTHRNGVTVTGSVTGNGSVTPQRKSTETEVPLAEANGAISLFPDEPGKVVDADTAFWDATKTYLTNAGVKNAGAMVGKWVRDHGKSATASAISRAQIERAVEPIPFIQACFRQPSQAPVVPL